MLDLVSNPESSVGGFQNANKTKFVKFWLESDPDFLRSFRQ